MMLEAEKYELYSTVALSYSARFSSDIKTAEQQQHQGQIIKTVLQIISLVLLINCQHSKL